ncbi:MAG: hypothetical protein COA38_15470 [Fluviicola sp.]|nr:MAG: hypothetical protein COA38_15470 [Fluviicola sp.]
MESRIKESSIFITGANGGIGRETVKQLLLEKPGLILLGCRKQEDADKLKSELQVSAGSTRLIAQGGFDMNNPSSIELAINEIPKELEFNIVFLQAGGVVFNDNYQFTEYKGRQFEKTVFQNALGGYSTLLELKRNSMLAKKARIVFAGGEGARGIKGMIKSPSFETNDQLLEYISHGNKEKYNPMNAIGVSKLVSALLVAKLSDLDQSKEYIWFSPGLTAGTNGLNALGGIKKFVMKHIIFNLLKVMGKAQSAQQAAKKNVSALAGRVAQSGDIIGAPEGKSLGKLVDQKPMNPLFTNHYLRDELWKIVSNHFGDLTKKQTRKNK